MLNKPGASDDTRGAKALWAYRTIRLAAHELATHYESSAVRAFFRLRVAR